MTIDLRGPHDAAIRVSLCLQSRKELDDGLGEITSVEDLRNPRVYFWGTGKVRK